MIEISDDIPPPAERTRGQPRFPFEGMKKGSSFYVPHPEAAVLLSYASAYKRAHRGWNYRSKQINGPTSCIGIRIWRTS